MILTIFPLFLSSHIGLGLRDVPQAKRLRRPLLIQHGALRPEHGRRPVLPPANQLLADPRHRMERGQFRAGKGNSDLLPIYPL